MTKNRVCFKNKQSRAGTSYDTIPEFRDNSIDVTKATNNEKQIASF